MSVTAMMSSQLLSSNTRSTSLTLPLKSAPKSGTSRRQRAGIVRASGMAEPESTGTGEFLLSTYRSHRMFLELCMQDFPLHAVLAHFVVET